ncbi:hypothetical protein DIE14_10485 [Burkholderia sp. Bp9017]|uniref:hypothetical protein n=1 Tax=unclassified Burkholderia TaxID=2613784 RepID=UPI000F5FB813|nr:MULTISPECIES: hypothetical protein [unclassified Burkholderia]RQZ27627.1 hypothetical protein DIE14_10485 [Burkholderia sp. Bp9017]RQZ35457.1 hypothetical protein DIE13_09080 [Burkholderia sp. Bp9016]
MQKVEITQHDLNTGSGDFHDYMKFVIQRLATKTADPALYLFYAAEIITADGHTINVGSDHDDVGVNVANWISSFYGDRENISHCLPALAYQINGVVYLLRFPIHREPQMLFTQAVIDFTDLAVENASHKSLTLLELTYNEFYNFLYLISRLDTTTVTHLQASAHRIYDGAAHYALARWESLYFVERAMKEILSNEGLAIKKGSDGHDVRGELHNAWIAARKPALPLNLLDDVMCSASIRYERTPQPFIATMRAHHAAIKLGALIARELPAPPAMEDQMSVELKVISRDPVLSLARLTQSLKPSIANGPYVQLLRVGTH